MRNTFDKNRPDILPPVDMPELNWWSWSLAQTLAATELHGLTAEKLAASYAVGLTTLKRRLQQEKTSFSEIVDNERRRRIMSEFSSDPAVTVEHLAFVCGFGEAKSMQRAMHRITGYKLTDWRTNPEACVNASRLAYGFAGPCPTCGQKVAALSG